MKRALSKLAKPLVEPESTENSPNLDFKSRLITPITIIILVLLFKPTVNALLSQASEVSVLGASFKFENNGDNIELSALELYYLIHANKYGVDSPLPKVFLEDDEFAALYLLKAKNLIFSKEEFDDEEGFDFLILTTTETGEGLIKQLNLN